MTRRHELWRSADGGEDSFFAADDDSARDLLEADARLICVIEADSWEDAQQKRYDFMGCGSYRFVDNEC